MNEKHRWNYDDGQKTKVLGGGKKNPIFCHLTTTNPTQNGNKKNLSFAI